MKRIFILRHAETQPSAGGGDRERKLTDRGMMDARGLGAVMRERGYVPEFILCSPVTRTRQTLEQVLESLGKIQTEFEKIIYEGGQPDLMQLLQGVDDKFGAVLVVGHNPSIHQFAASLADEDSKLMDQLAAGYAPGTLTVLDVPHMSWADVRMGENKLIDIITH